MQESWIHSLGWEDPLEEEMVTHSSILAWEIPWTEEPWVAKIQTGLSNYLFNFHCIEEATFNSSICFIRK